MPSALLPMRPRVPITPILSASSFRRTGSDTRMPSVLDAGSARFVTSGRVAIALALREMGAGPGDTVLVPAFHSPSMIPPVLWRGATPVFYRVGPDGAADLEDIAAKAAGARVLMVTHFFGFHQDLAALRALCDRLGLGMLEDCAHAFIGEHKGRPLGAWGDYAVASSMKFFPIYEGGVLVSGRHSLDAVSLHSAGMAFEAKIALNSLERGFDYGRLPAVRAALWLPMALKKGLWRLRARKPAPPLAPSSSDSSFDFDPRWVDKRSSLFARGMLRLVSPGRIAALRRANWLRLDRALRGLPGVQPLFDTLPEGVCPWVYPLLAEDAPRLAARLSAAGVPVVGFGRPLWQGVDASVCPNAARLSASVLSLPCHQELREHELDWMIAAATKALQA